MNQKRTSDTLPRPGLVNKVCKDWLVLEDGALAYQLQQQEVSEHLTGNKQRNAIVREDIPHAKLLQREVEEEAARLAVLREERDRKLAEELLAGEVSKKHHSLRQCRPPKLEGDINEVGLPLPPSPPRAATNHHYYEIVSAEEEEDWPPPPPSLQDQISKEEQERKDLELAARLQEEEALSEELDRKLAIEAQDEEYARMLQEREKLRARRAREKARAKRLQADSPSPSPSLPPLANLPPPHLVSPVPHRGNEVPNIAMAIDPTYQRYNTTGVRRPEDREKISRDEIRHSSRSLPNPPRDRKGY